MSHLDQTDDEASKKANVTQTQIGPIDCCTDQGTNPNDRFSIDEDAMQEASSPIAFPAEHPIRTPNPPTA